MLGGPAAAPGLRLGRQAHIQPLPRVGDFPAKKYPCLTSTGFWDKDGWLKHGSIL